VKELETERLRLRHLEAGHIEPIHRAIYGDPEVCRYFCGETRSIERTRAWFGYRSYQSRDEEFGLLAVVLKGGGEVIGLCGLQAYVGHWLRLESEPGRSDNPLEVELTYAFGRAYWGQGYAAEACRPMIDYAFRDLRLRRLVTGCHPDNDRASRLQDRLGMRKERNLHPDWPGWVGILDNDTIEPRADAAPASSTAD
jgi:ribosomal-protein-alanine N-acetyltransferase